MTKTIFPFSPSPLGEGRGEGLYHELDSAVFAQHSHCFSILKGSIQGGRKNPHPIPRGRASFTETCTPKKKWENASHSQRLSQLTYVK
jgi:hypothetical protein